MSKRTASPAIRFGTSGWRGKIARDFTFDNVRLVSQAVADYLNGERRRSNPALARCTPVVILAHDTRFLGREFALAVADVLAANQLTPLLCQRDTPTPAVAHAIRARKAIGGINITASHNPAEYQGFKLSTSNGAAATPEPTSHIERLVAKLQKTRWSFPAAVAGTFACKTFDPQPAYFRQVERLVDFQSLRQARLRVAVEVMHGTGRGYLDQLLERAGAKVTLFHPDPNPLFGGRPPEPDAEGMAEVSRFVRSGKAQIGLGLDGDADRFGIVDQSGAWITPNQVLALTLYHLKKNRGWTGAVVRTVLTSHQVDAVAETLGVQVHETPVGFKYIGALMESEPIIVGGEESGGLSVKGHVPEKDGILACLLMAELVAVEQRSLREILKSLERETGRFLTNRIDMRVPPGQKQKLLQRLSRGLDQVGPAKVQQFLTLDGFKFLLPEGEWVAFQASGTEPLIRCYIEAKSPRSMSRLKAACQKILLG